VSLCLGCLLFPSAYRSNEKTFFRSQIKPTRRVPQVRFFEPGPWVSFPSHSSTPITTAIAPLGRHHSSLAAGALVKEAACSPMLWWGGCHAKNVRLLHPGFRTGTRPRISPRPILTFATSPILPCCSNPFVLNPLQTHLHNGINTILLESMPSAHFSSRRRVYPFKPKFFSPFSLLPAIPVLILSRTYEMQISQPLSFDIHANWWGGVYPSSYSQAPSLLFLSSFLSLMTHNCKLSAVSIPVPKTCILRTIGVGKALRQTLPGSHFYVSAGFRVVLISSGFVWRRRV
jgi:hypothetical protein